MADIFDVVADGTRREILVFLAKLAKTEPGEVNVSGIVQELGVSQPTVSKHLKVLREASLVTVREDGQLRFYSIDTAPLGVVSAWLENFAVEGEHPDAAAVVAAPLGADSDEADAELPPVLASAAQRLGTLGARLVKKTKSLFSR